MHVKANPKSKKANTGVCIRDYARSLRGIAMEEDGF